MKSGIAMRRASQFAVVVLACCALVVGCASPQAPGTQLAGTSMVSPPPASPPAAALTAPCEPTENAAFPAMPQAGGPFSYSTLDEPATDLDTVDIDGNSAKYRSSELILTFKAADVTMDLPEGKIAGVLAHKELIEPVLREFNLEVIEQERIPELLIETTGSKDGSPPPSPAEIRQWSVKPTFLVRVIDAESVPLTNLQADATVLGVRGAWTFHNRSVAGVFARLFQVMRRKDCYQLEFIGPNGQMSTS